MAERVSFPPPPGLDANAAAVWREIVAAHSKPALIVGPELEVYCGQVALARDARRRVALEGAIVAGPKKDPIPHPALAVEAAAIAKIAKWGSRFAPPPPMSKRRSGTVYDASKVSVEKADHLKPEVFAGPVAAMLTLAWLIDEAQRAGLEALQKAAFGTIPTYLKACAELRITPASLPVAPAGVVGPAPQPSPETGGSRNVSDFTAAAKRKRPKAG